MPVILDPTVYLLQSGSVESVVLAVALALLRLFELVLDDATLGGK